MRIGLAFAVGLLVGVLFWPRDAPERQDRAPGPRVEPEAPRATRTHAGPVESWAAEADAAIDRDVVDAAQWLGGDGVITGVVRDPAGAPVAGVTVATQVGAYPEGLFAAHRPALHEDRDLADVARAAIRTELWRRRARRVAVTGSDGRYRLEGLSEKPTYSLTAFHESYDVRPTKSASRLGPGAAVDFLARPVVSVTVEVVGADGARVERASVSWRSGRNWGSARWSPADPHLRLPRDGCTLRAQAWGELPLQSEPVETGPISGGARIVLRMRARRILNARVVLPDGLALPDSLQYRARRLGANEEPAEPRYDELRLEGNSPTPGLATWYDIAAGRYLVAAFLGQRPFAHAVVELTAGPADVDLPAADLTRRRHLVVHTLLPTGGHPTGRAWFRVVVAGRSWAPTALRRTDGGWVVPLEDVEAGGDAVLVVQLPDYGTVEQPVSLDDAGPVTVRFAAPARLRVRLDGDAAGMLVQLWKGDAFTAGAAVDGEGRCELVAQPGTHELRLVARSRDRSWPIHQRSIALGGGVRELTLPVPPLFTLEVRRPEGGGVGWVTLHSSDPAVGPVRRRGRFDGDVLTFDRLGAGRYEIEVSSKRIEVRVPGPVLQLD